MCRDCKQRLHKATSSAVVAVRAQQLPERLPCTLQGSWVCLLRVDGAMQELLTAALSSDWTPKQALILERTEDVESVVDAVQRVASHLPQVSPLFRQLHASSAEPYAGQAAYQEMVACLDV